MARPYRRRRLAVAVVVPALGGLAITANMSFMDGGRVAMAYLLCGLFGSAVLLFGMHTLTVDVGAIEAKLGIGVFKQRVPLAEIRSFEPVTSRWYFTFTSVLYLPIGGYELVGLEAVDVFTRDGSRVRFSTTDARAVCQALHARVGRLPPLSQSERAAARFRYWTIPSFSLLALFAATIGVVAYLVNGSPR